MTALLERYHALTGAIAPARLLAVSKTHPAEPVAELLAAGHRHFGENRVQEAAEKYPALKERYPDLRLHLIGPLQTNKVRQAVALFDVIETLDRPKLAKALANEMALTGRRIPCLIEVNIGAEPQKAGIAPEETAAFLFACRGEWKLEITGLMCIPPAGEDPAPHFRRLAGLAAELGLAELSMGMSGDYQQAIACGATEIRVGTALFGGAAQTMTHAAARYGVSLFCVGLALAVGLLLGPGFDVKLGPLLFLGAVVLTAWFAGSGPGLAAIIFSTLAVEYFWTEPAYSFIVVRQELPLMTSFILCGLAGLALSLQRRKQARESLENRTTLERRVAERTAQLRISEERWRNLFETSSVGIAITEPDGRILRANLALQAMLGYSETDLRLLALSDLMAGTMGTGEERGREGGLELSLRRADGHILWVSLSVSVIPASDGSPPLTSAVVVDISARRRAIEDWRKGQSEVARATRLTTMGVLAASIAHEVNQPLSGVVTNGQAADRWLSAEMPDISEARAALSRIVRDGNRAAEIIRSIRNVLDPVGQEPKPLSINNVIERLVPLVENELAAQSIRLVLDLGEKLPAVTGDAVQLQQLILNLILNSIDAMRGTVDAERVLAVRTICAGTDVVVSVEDHGSGLPEIEHDRLFEPFFTTKAEGMGVGLAICRTVVESHGGRIWAEPLAPHGAKFAFALPAAEQGGTLPKKKERKR